MLVLLILVIYEYTLKTASVCMIYMPIIMKISSGIQIILRVLRQQLRDCIVEIIERKDLHAVKVVPHTRR
jgi:hypothetical protein